mmetsp:Transcript_15410/g.29049  ORF Transcript_15410/g.29049 Transcript_15410/m.29049 type:complete len:90 (+) Transcript_15410:902-1171(+)
MLTENSKRIDQPLVKLEPPILKEAGVPIISHQVQFFCLDHPLLLEAILCQKFSRLLMDRFPDQDPLVFLAPATVSLQYGEVQYYVYFVA